MCNSDMFKFNKCVTITNDPTLCMPYWLILLIQLHHPTLPPSCQPSVTYSYHLYPCTWPSHNNSLIIVVHHAHDLALQGSISIKPNTSINSLPKVLFRHHKVSIGPGMCRTVSCHCSHPNHRPITISHGWSMCTTALATWAIMLIIPNDEHACPFIPDPFPSFFL